MKRLAPLFALILATSCSHADPKVSQPSAAPAPATSASSPSAKSTSKAASALDTASCKHGSDVRGLAVVVKGEGCAVTYTKHGQTNELASADHDTNHCKEVVAKVRSHLEAAGFSCN